MSNSIVYVCVYTYLCYTGLCRHMCLFDHILLLLGVCLWVHKGSITLCAAGGLWSVSAPKAPRTWLDRCVWWTYWSAEQQRAAAQSAHSGLEGDNRDIAGPL